MHEDNPMPQPFTVYFVGFEDETTRWCRLGTARTGAEGWVDLDGRFRPWADGRAWFNKQVTRLDEIGIDLPDFVVRIQIEDAQDHLLDPNCDTGWVAPDGTFYGCADNAHDDLALALLRKDVRDLEREGWIRVHAETFMFGGADGNGKATRAQGRTLAGLGYGDPASGSSIPRQPPQERKGVPTRRIHDPLHRHMAGGPAEAENRVQPRF
jgi:hypothetical protein